MIISESLKVIFPDHMIARFDMHGRHFSGTFVRLSRCVLTNMRLWRAKWENLVFDSTGV